MRKHADFSHLYSSKTTGVSHYMGEKNKAPANGVVHRAEAILCKEYLSLIFRECFRELLL